MDILGWLIEIILGVFNPRVEGGEINWGVKAIFAVVLVAIILGVVFSVLYFFQK